METTIFVKKLRIEARHGVMPQERTVGNTFELDIELRCSPAHEALEADRLDGTIDYAEIVGIATAEMAIPSKLLEHAAERIRRALLRRWPHISGGTVRLTKLTPPVAAQMAGAGVALTW